MRRRHYTVSVATAIVALACGTAVYQQRTLATLKEETRSLEKSFADRQAESSSTPGPTESPSLRREQSEASFPEAESALFDIIHSPGVSPEQYERFALATREMDVPSLIRLIAVMKTHPDLPPSERQDFEIHFAHLLAHEQPEKALAVIQSMPGLAPDGKQLCYPFRQWMAKDPASAAHWFEEQLRKNDPTTIDPELRRQAIQAFFRANPDRGLNLALSLLPVGPEPAREVNKLAAETVASLADEREHASFLAALRRVAEKSPGNLLLEKIRAAYLNELPARLKVWNFDDVVTLLDDELSASEKRVTARNLSTFSDLETPGKWADWFSKIGGEMNEEHPLGNYLRSWSLADSQGVSKWLACLPDSATKVGLVREHANRIRDPFPEEAARLALTLPANPQREDLLRAVYASWKIKDPAAAASFAEQNGL